VVGLVLIGISVPLILRKVPPNSFYGCRTRKTLSDPKIWYEANQISGKDFCTSGAIVLVASLLMLLFGKNLNTNFAVVTLVMVLLLSMAGVVLHGLVTLKRM
jgi:uncharacterized membrane protein